MPRTPVYWILPIVFLSTVAIACGSRKDGAGPNRASAYCEALGYRTGFAMLNGVSARACLFTEKQVCELWDFYRGRCGRRYSRCEKNGYILRPRVEELPNDRVEYAVCLFDDGSECVEQDFAEGKCKRTECKKWRFAQGGCIRAPEPF